jgi:hypothetical protein
MCLGVDIPVVSLSDSREGVARESAYELVLDRSQDDRMVGEQHGFGIWLPQRRSIQLADGEDHTREEGCESQVVRLACLSVWSVSLTRDFAPSGTMNKRRFKSTSPALRRNRKRLDCGRTFR